MVIFYPQNSPGLLPLEIIGHSLLWRIPALFLILMLTEKKPSISLKKDFLVLAAVLPALILAGFLATFFADKTGTLPSVEIKPPQGGYGWIAVMLLSLSIGFLEEAYFRLYLPEKLIELFSGYSASLNKTEYNSGKTGQLRKNRIVAAAFLVSALIFALCHAYGGPWGIVNAILASLILSFAYVKSSSFTGIAFAHGLYNIIVFLASALEG